MARPSLALAVVTLLTLAGCGLPISSAPTTTTGESTLTPAPVPGGANDAERLAPGVTTDGVVDPALLTAAHRDYYASHGYRRVTVTEHVFDDGSVEFLDREVRRFDPGNGTVLVRTREADPRVNLPPVTRDQWSNGSLRAARVRYDDGATQYGVRPATGSLVDDHGGTVASLLAEQGATVVGKRTGNGTTEYVLAVENPTGVGPGVGGRLVAVVTATGRIHTVRYTAQREIGGARVTYRIRQSYAPLSTGVGRPPWLDAALDTDGAGEP